MDAALAPDPTAITLAPGRPQTHGGITVVPLLATAPPRADYLTLDAALPRGFTITEVDDAGHVPELLVGNPLDRDVLLYDGEEVVGAKQNRVLEASILVAAGATHPIPVACVEAGRWHGPAGGFTAADRVSHPESRRRKAAELEHAPLAQGVAQSAVWREIDERIHETGAHAATRAIADVHEAQRDRIDAVADAFALVEGQCGAILALGDGLCLDLVSRPDAWTALWPKLRRGYLLDGVRHLADDPTPHDLVDRFVERVIAAGRTSRPSPGRGEDQRLHGPAVSGSALVLDGELIQLSAYTRHGDGPTALEQRGRIARPSRRHR
ncbi:MAG: ARPP-1 family domain-containing protein [Actinomycetota bacterium]